MKKRKSGIKRSGRVKARNHRRRELEHARAYCGLDRVQWIKSQPCVVSGEQANDVQNAHVKTGGMGRKADYIWIVPMRAGYHRQLHRVGVESFQAIFGVDLVALAEETQRRWLAYLLDRDPLCEHCMASVAVAPALYCAACQYEIDGGHFADDPCLPAS